MPLESPKLGIFAFKRKLVPENPSSKSTLHNKHNSEIIEGDEVIENSSNTENESDEDPKNCPEWVKLNKDYWKQCTKKFDPEELFNPLATPNGKGFVCNLSEIFPKKKLKSANGKESGMQWT